MRFRSWRRKFTPDMELLFLFRSISCNVFLFSPHFPYTLRCGTTTTFPLLYRYGVYARRSRGIIRTAGTVRRGLFGSVRYPASEHCSLFLF